MTDCSKLSDRELDLIIAKILGWKENNDRTGHGRFCPWLDGKGRVRIAIPQFTLSRDLAYIEVERHIEWRGLRKEYAQQLEHVLLMREIAISGDVSAAYADENTIKELLIFATPRQRMEAAAVALGK